MLDGASPARGARGLLQAPGHGPRRRSRHRSPGQRWRAGSAPRELTLPPRAPGV